MASAKSEKAKEAPRKLRFSYSSHLLEDLGVNLYTSLSKALVEFVANAYDADSPGMSLKFDMKAIEVARNECQVKYEKEKLTESKKAKPGEIVPLERRALSPEVTIVLEDTGHGMTTDEVEEKFLVIGRRRREGSSGQKKSPGKRIVMGRKGLGKLAGFGISQRIEVLTRAKGKSYTTKIVLDYEQLLKAGGGTGATVQSNSDVPTEILFGKHGLRGHGTKIILSQLVYQTAKSVDDELVANSLSRHFGVIDPKDFSIKLNKRTVWPTKRTYQYSHPVDKNRALDVLIPAYVQDSESGRKHTFSYRLRFTAERKYLPASERGVRVYAHSRLASLPSLLDVNSSVHGFRYSDYLDGIVVADFIDDLPIDYIATDRSDLRWDIHPLSDLREFLTKEIEDGLKKFADVREKQNETKVQQDPFTKKIIEATDLSDRRRKTAYKFAQALASSETAGLGSAYYQSTLGQVIGALGHGEVVTTISKLASQSDPALLPLIAEITKLTGIELDEFIRIARIRIKAIDALEKIVRKVDFAASKRERELHNLLKTAPWLIDPTFFEFLLSDEEETVLACRLSKKLGVGANVSKDYNPSVTDESVPLGSNRRPDLVQLFANEHLKRIVIIELKAANTPLHFDHLVQLEDYVRHTREWLQAKGSDYAKGFEIEGYLIGSHADSSSVKNEKVKRLQAKLEEKSLAPGIHVLDLLALLDRTKMAHKELLQAQKAKPGSDD